MRKRELELENEILSAARKAVEDEAIFTSELRGQKIQYEKEYKDYIAQQRQQEADRQIEMDRLYLEDQKREWEQRDEIQKAQRKARQSLLQDVLQTREKQLQFRETSRKEEEEENRKERARMIEVSLSFMATGYRWQGSTKASIDFEMRRLLSTHFNVDAIDSRCMP